LYKTVTVTVTVTVTHRKSNIPKTLKQNNFTIKQFPARFYQLVVLKLLQNIKKYTKGSAFFAIHLPDNALICQNMYRTL